MTQFNEDEPMATIADQQSDHSAALDAYEKYFDKDGDLVAHVEKAPASDIITEVETDPLAGVENDIAPTVKQLGASGSTVTTFNAATGIMDFVRGEAHFSLSADELKALLAHLYDLRDDIYEVCNARYERQHKQFYGKYQ